MRFTNSPFEDMMQEKPYCPRKHRNPPPQKCADCPKWWDSDDYCRKCTRITTEGGTSGQPVQKLR